MRDVVKESKALFYAPPDTLDAFVDPLIRPICEEINRSGWVWTAESCQGHPDGDRSGVWAGNNAPMLRLVTQAADLGRMLALLARAYAKKSAEPPSPDLPELQGIRMFPSSRPEPGWSEILIYLDASNVYQRNCALDVWTIFAKLLAQA